MSASLAAVGLAGLATVLVAMTMLWVVSLRLRDASIVDPFWAPGFALVTLAYLIADGRFAPRGVLALVLVSVWAARLGFHLLRRNLRSGEDPRYGAMRERHGAGFGRVSLFTVFWLQAILLWIISAPLAGSVVSVTPLGAWDLLGALVFLIGFSFEAVADLQLERFKADSASVGRVLDTGLWRYSRHPNYFGNAVLWWGLYLVAVGGGAYWTVFGPILMTYLLLRVSGVTLLEKGLARSRPGYAQYADRTSAFVPWPPKR
jgi:steroid 5-alpha reductase family enzyme